MRGVRENRRYYETEPTRMDLKQILELLGQEHVPGDEMTGAFLEDAVASFALNPAGATNSIRQLQASDPPGFVLAAVRLLTQTEEKSAGVQYVAGLMFQGNLLIDALLDKRILAHDAATALARNLATAEPLLDVRLVRKMLANAAGDIRAVKAEAAMRVVRSKVGLLLGRSNLNLNRIKSFLASDDARLRANAVESMWGLKDRSVVTILWDATKDSHRRVVINALVGLCRAGERDAFDRLIEMAGSGEAMMRAGVAWAMGEIGAPEFAEPLQKLSADNELNVRSMAGKSLNKLPVAAAEISA